MKPSMIFGLLRNDLAKSWLLLAIAIISFFVVLACPTIRVNAAFDPPIPPDEYLMGSIVNGDFEDGLNDWSGYRDSGDFGVQNNGGDHTAYLNVQTVWTL